MSEVESYKNQILGELEKNGFVGTLRASVKSQVLKALEKQPKQVKQNIEFDYLTQFHKLNKSKEVILAVHLMREFLKFFELEYTVPILENETNIRENIPRDSIMKEFHLKETSSSYEQPILVQILTNYLRDFTKVENMKREESHSYGSFPNFHGQGGDIGNNKSTDTDILQNNIQSKPKLAPLNFKSNNDNNDFPEFQGNEESPKNNLTGSGENKFNTTDLYSNLDHENKSPTTEELFNSTIKKTGTTASNLVAGLKIASSAETGGDDGKDEIAEDIHVDTGGDQDDNDNNMKSMGSNLYASSQTFGYDNSVTSYNLEFYEYTEDVEKP